MRRCTAQDRTARDRTRPPPLLVPASRLASGERLTSLDCVLMAIGRTPVTAELGLEATGVQLDGKGRVVVDEKQATLPRHFLDTSYIPRPELAPPPLRLAALVSPHETQ